MYYEGKHWSIKEMITLGAFIFFWFVGLLAMIIGAAAHLTSTSQTVQHAIGMRYERQMADVAKYLEDAK